MRALIQCVSEARVDVGGKTVGSIGRGFLIFLGVGENDGEKQAEKLWHKISRMRVFEDEAGKTNLALSDVEGEVLVVSQFTLYANCRKGNRPSFTDAAAPAEADRLYNYFCELARTDVPRVQQGVFGAMMNVHLVNHGPFTIWLDTDDLASPRRQR